ncbi:MAG: ABC transporter substrate-binding protein [Candidatus Thorarchaeota archaeon]
MIKIKLIKTDMRRMILPLAMLLVLTIAPFYAQPVKAANPGPFFTISVLAPNTNPARNQWATLMVEQLPKIGIGVDIFDHTNWAGISPRTWGYTAGTIPSYAEGGYDIFFVGNGWGLDFDPTGVFTSDGWVEDGGDNYYQYASTEMDWAVGNYTQSFVFADRMEWAKEIQSIFYEDVPTICLLYETALYSHVEGLTGWDGLLWASSYEPMENWQIPGETEFHYATPADFEDFHPILYESVYDAEWLNQIYNGLVQRDAANSYGYSPRICSDFSSTDGLTYSINLKPNVKWGDGTPLTVDDIIYSYQLYVTPGLGHSTYSYNTNYWNNDSITKISDTEMTITFLQPYVFMDGLLSALLLPEHIWGSIAPEDHGAQAIEWAKNNPENIIGCGPYKLASYDATNQVIHLTANEYFDDWFGSAPNFDDVYFEFYGSKEGAIASMAAGDIQMVSTYFKAMPDELELPGITYTLVDDPGNQEMPINNQHPYMGTGALCPIAGEESAKNVRKAINHIVPREIIVEEILQGLGSPGVTYWPKASVGFDDTLEVPEYNINLALQYMKDAGFDVTIPTEPTGLGLVVVISILSLVGAIQVVFLKRRK